MIPRDFIRLLKPDAQALEKEFGVPAAVTLAQAALETGWLAHPILHSVSAQEELKKRERGQGRYVDLPDGFNSKNLFGIKAFDAPDFVVCWTQEWNTAHKAYDRIPARFRRYNSYADSLRDRVRFFQQNPRYRDLLGEKDPVVFAWGLQAAGYATDPQYADKLIRIMRIYGLS